MLQIITLAVLVAMAAAIPAPSYLDTAAFDQWSNERIVGGSTAAVGQVPYQASLRIIANNWHFCGGSIVNARWIVSAAHCTETSVAAEIRAVLGAHNRVTGGTPYGIQRIVNHPGYNRNTLANDISLLRTVTNIVFTSTVRAVSVGTAARVPGGVASRASGWGQTSHPGQPATLLQVLNVLTLTNEECRSRHNVINARRVFDNTICTFGAVGNGLCMGDSGGPLVANNVLIGAVSWGEPCGTGRPDVFARISTHLDFILPHINQL